MIFILNTAWACVLTLACLVDLGFTYSNDIPKVLRAAESYRNQVKSVFASGLHSIEGGASGDIVIWEDLNNGQLLVDKTMRLKDGTTLPRQIHAWNCPIPDKMLQYTGPLPGAHAIFQLFDDSDPQFLIRLQKLGMSPLPINRLGTNLDFFKIAIQVASESPKIPMDIKNRLPSDLKLPANASYVTLESQSAKYSFVIDKNRGPSIVYVALTFNNEEPYRSEVFCHLAKFGDYWFPNNVIAKTFVNDEKVHESTFEIDSCTLNGTSPFSSISDLDIEPGAIVDGLGQSSMLMKWNGESVVPFEDVLAEKELLDIWRARGSFLIRWGCIGLSCLVAFAVLRKLKQHTK